LIERRVVPRYGLPLQELPVRAFDAVDASERAHAFTVLLRDGAPVAAIVPIEDLDRIDPPDPGASGGDPLMALAGSCKRDAFADNVVLALGGAVAYDPGARR
jgi:hypothetical protein